MTEICMRVMTPAIQHEQLHTVPSLALECCDGIGGPPHLNYVISMKQSKD